MDKDVEQVLDNFNFEKVKKVMIALDWKWYINLKEGCQVPSMYQLIKQAERLLYDIKKRDCIFLATGGFEVHYQYGSLTLKFILEESNHEEEGKEETIGKQIEQTSN